MHIPPILLGVFLHGNMSTSLYRRGEGTYTKVNRVVSRDLQMGRVDNQTDGDAVNEKAYISRYAAVDNHGDHRTVENNDHKRVDQAEPMDPRVEDMEIVIPSSSLLRVI